MIKFIVNLVFLFLLSGCAADSAPLEIEEKKLEPSMAKQIPAEMKAAWNSLRIAILANDSGAVGAGAHFPLRSLDYSLKGLKSTGELKKKFTHIFEPELVKIIKKGEFSIVKGEPGYEVDCAEGYMIFGFEKYEGKYLLSYFGSINE